MPGKPQTPPFAVKLAELMEERGWTIYGLAKRTGLTETTCANLLRGFNPTTGGPVDPQWTSIQRLALAFGVPLEAFADPGLTVPEYERGTPGRKRKEPEEGGGDEGG